MEALTELVRDAPANGDSLTGPSGLLKDLTKMVLEISLEEEMTEHLGHGKHQDRLGPARRGTFPRPRVDPAAVGLQPGRHAGNGFDRGVEGGTIRQHAGSFPGRESWSKPALGYRTPRAPPDTPVTLTSQGSARHRRHPW